MSPAAILAKLENPTSADYVVLKQAVPATTAAAITALNEPGIAMTPSYTREYPNGDLAANLIGFTNTNAAGVLTGQAGIEQSDNSLLAGRAGQQEVQIGTNGQPIPVAGETTRPMVPGDNVRLTILAGLQWEAEQACAQEVKKTDASNCTVVIMQPSTGKILAMAQSPSFNPAHPASLAGTTDLPVSDVFDPGSTAKVITASAAFEHGGQTPMSAYTVPDQIVIDGYPFHDAEYHPTERWTIAGIIAHSSNVGMVQVVQHVSPQTQYQYFRNFGIGAAQRARPARGEQRHPVPDVAVVGGRAVHAGVRPGRGGHRGPDGQRLRHDRQRRGAGDRRPSWREPPMPAGSTCPRRGPPPAGSSRPRRPTS